MYFYFIWLFKCVLTVPCSKFGNEETRIILYSLLWFPECWFGLATSTYKLISLTVFKTSNSLTFSEGMMGLRCFKMSWFPFLLSLNEFLVVAFVAWNISDKSQEILYFVLALNDIALPKVCQGWSSSLVLCQL